jgi:hypothetical protein
VNRLSGDQELEQDLKTLNTVYDELSRDARTIAKDLSEAVSAYFLLGFYMLALSFGLDWYFLLSRSLALSDLGFVVFMNLVLITAGCFVLYRYSKLNRRYGTLFSLEKDIRLKEAKSRSETGPK